MRAFRSFILATGILATGLLFAGRQADAGVHVYVTAGPAAPPYYDAYGNYYPGRWIAVQGWRGRQWREHEWHEHTGWDRDREEQGNWHRHGHRDRDEEGDEDR